MKKAKPEIKKSKVKPDATDMKKKPEILRSTSARINEMCSDIMADTAKASLENLRFLRDIAARDGDMRLALKAASAIDRKRGLYS